MDDKQLKVIEHHQFEWDEPKQLQNSGSDQQPSAPISAIRKTIENLNSSWTNAIVIAPSEKYLSINLELPFSDNRQIQKVLSLEVQDRVPFDVEELVLEHHVVGTLSDTGHDVHVGMTPRSSVKEVLGLCKQGEFEPLYLCTPMSALAAIHYIAPDYISPACAIVYARGPYIYVTLCLDHVARADRVIVRGELKRFAKDALDDAPLTDLKLTLIAFESRYEKNLEKVYILGQGLQREELQQALGRNVEYLALEGLVKSEPGAANLASIASVFALDEQAPPLLSNFRVQEFSYSPRLREVFLGLKKVAPYFFAALAALVIAVAGTMLANEFYVSRIRSKMTKEILELYPDAAQYPNQELDAFRGEMTRLQDQLKSLGSLSKLSPIDSLIALTKDFPRDAGATVRSVNIKNNRIEIEGTAPDYGTVDRIEKALNTKKDVYRRVKTDASQNNFAGGAGGLPFKIEIWLSES